MSGLNPSQFADQFDEHGQYKNPKFKKPAAVQRRLPGVNWHKEAPMAQPHEMSFDQFARSPRTVWHSSHSKLSPSDEETPSHTSYGFHVGSQDAALVRAGADVGDAARVMHPLRIKPGAIKPGMIQDQGEDWDRQHFGHWYINDYEDSGSRSAILPTAHETVSYLGFARQARAAGKGLHPDAERALIDHESSWGDHGPHFQAVHTSADLPPREKVNYAEQFHALMDQDTHEQGRLFEGGPWNNYEGQGGILVGRVATPEENEARRRLEDPVNSRLLISPKVKQEPWMKKTS